MTFATENDEPIQVITPRASFVLPVEDLTAVLAEQRGAEAQRRAQAEAIRPFDLATGPLMRARLLQLDPDEHVLLLTMHHIVSDGWSMGIVFQELSAFYEAFTRGKLPGLPELSIQYASYTLWQREWLQGEELERQLGYWRKQLEGAPPVLELPTDRPRPTVPTYRGQSQSLTLSPELSQGLKRLSRAEGVTLFMTLLAAFQTLLYRYTGQADLVVGAPIANRTRTEVEGLIGFFVNTLVFRTDLSGDPSFQELLRRVRSTCLEAYAHQDLPFEKLVEELQPERRLNQNPLFQVGFALQNTSSQALSLPDLDARLVEVDAGTSKFDLTLVFYEKEDHLEGALEYSTDRFDGARMTRMIGHLQVLLEALVANPDSRVSLLPLLKPFEKDQLLKEWNDTRVDFPSDRMIHQLFEAQVEQTPTAIAVSHEDKQLTYSQLNHRANQLAHRLTSLGVGPDVLVGIYMERSLDVVVALLGVLKSGGAYVPLDPAYPDERLRFVIEDADIHVLLTQQCLLAGLAECRSKIMTLDTETESIAQESAENPRAW